MPKRCRLTHSPRLLRVLELLSDGLERSTMEIVHGANVVAVDTCLREIEQAGIPVGRRRTRIAHWYRILPEGRIRALQVLGEAALCGAGGMARDTRYPGTPGGGRLEVA